MPIDFHILPFFGDRKKLLKNAEWHPTMSLGPQQLQDGTSASGLLMKCRIKGYIAYRLPTPEEGDQYFRARRQAP